MTRQAIMYGGPFQPRQHADDCGCPRCVLLRNPPFTQPSTKLYVCKTCMHHVVKGTECPWCTKSPDAATMIADLRKQNAELHEALGKALEVLGLIYKDTNAGLMDELRRAFNRLPKAAAPKKKSKKK